MSAKMQDVSFSKMKRIECKNRKAWEKERSKGIGGSDAAAVVGQNKYMTNIELWRIKTGKEEAENISKKQCVIYGHKAEKPMIELFKLDYPEFEVTRNPYTVLVNEEYEWLRGTLDGELYHKESKTCGIFEIKTTTCYNSEQFMRWNGQIPNNYYVQLLHYFLIDECFKFAILKVLINFIDGYKMKAASIRHYLVKREEVEEDLEYLFNAEKDFWRCVESDKEPKDLM